MIHMRHALHYDGLGASRPQGHAPRNGGSYGDKSPASGGGTRKGLGIALPWAGGFMRARPNPSIKPAMAGILGSFRGIGPGIDVS